MILKILKDIRFNKSITHQDMAKELFLQLIQLNLGKRYDNPNYWQA